MPKYYFNFILVIILISLAACTPLAGQPAAPAATFTQLPAVVQPTSLPAATQMPPSSTPTLIPSTVPAPVEKTSGLLWVKILSPLDNSTVNTAEVVIQGSAPVDTVLTINDEIVLVGSDQKFAAKISLDEGINVIEVLASDISGNEVFIPLTIFYEK
jgi:hypothetical protein